MPVQGNPDSLDRWTWLYQGAGWSLTSCQDLSPSQRVIHGGVAHLSQAQILEFDGLEFILGSSPGSSVTSGKLHNPNGVQPLYLQSGVTTMRLGGKCVYRV